MYVYIVSYRGLVNSYIYIYTEDFQQKAVVSRNTRLRCRPWALMWPGVGRPVRIRVPDFQFRGRYPVEWLAVDVLSVCVGVCVGSHSQFWLLVRVFGQTMFPYSVLYKSETQQKTLTSQPLDSRHVEWQATGLCWDIRSRCWFEWHVRANLQEWVQISLLVHTTNVCIKVDGWAAASETMPT